jgi:glucose/arabinose dehydrogenase
MALSEPAARVRPHLPAWSPAPLLLALLGVMPPATAATEPSLEVLVDGIEAVSSAIAAPDGSDRIYLLEHYTGRIRLLENGVLADQPFLDLGEKMAKPENWEQGLLGLALPPHGEPVAYVTYVGRSGELILSRFATADDGRRGLEGSEHVIHRVQSPHHMHHCGHIAFGPQDGMLYLCVGDTQDNQEIRPVSQDPAGSLGRILRFDVHAPMIAEAEAGGPIAAYASPPPFGGPETVAYGLRNPWRFDFDPASGGMFIPDVGRWNSEELNFLPADHAPSPNLGWPLAEGNECLIDCGARDDLIWPVFEYTQTDDRCAIIGGATYGGTATPAWRDVYVFADLCSGEFWALRNPGLDAEVRLLMDSEATPVGILRGPDGELLVVDDPGRALYRLRFPASAEGDWRPARTVMAEAALETRRSGFTYTRELMERAREEKRYMEASRRWRMTEPLVQLYDWLGRPLD